MIGFFGPETALESISGYWGHSLLRIYRRHSPGCKHSSQSYRRCSCPIHVEGRVNWKPVRKSLHTRKWDEAVLKVRKMEAQGLATELGETLIDTAVQLYIQDAISRNLSSETVRSIKTVIESGFLPKFEGKRLAEITAQDLLTYRAAWNYGSLTALKRWERIRSFFRWCQRNWLCQINPCEGLRSPKARLNPTLPYSDDEVTRILDALQDKPVLHALVSVLLCSGLRISDAVQLQPSNVVGDVLILRTAKTGTDVRVPIARSLVDELALLPAEDGYYFWNPRRIKLRARIGDLTRTMLKVYAEARITGGKFHKFRDTAAVRWLLAGLSVKAVATLLGNSVRIVEKHYAAWVQNRQDQLEEVVRRTWS